MTRFARWRRVVAAPVLGVFLAGLASCAPTGARSQPSTQQCRLPVITIDSSTVVPGAAKFSSDVSITAGWVSIPQGRLAPATNSEVQGLPFGRAYPGQAAQPRSYDSQYHRWLPVDQNQVSPDGAAYFYVAAYTSPLQVHVYSLPAARDVVVWSDLRNLEQVSWKGGALVIGLTDADGSAESVTVDAKTGAVEGTTFSANASQAIPPPAVYGFDAQGRAIVRLGGFETGEAYSIAIETGSPSSLTIYSGTVGDAMDFQPFGPAIDGPIIWFGNNDNRYLFEWSAASGLRRIQLEDAGPVGGVVNTRPVGACEPI